MNGMEPNLFAPPVGMPLPDAQAAEDAEVRAALYTHPDVRMLDDECTRWSSTYGHWNERYARALDLEGTLEVEVKQFKAAAYLAHRETRGPDGKRAYSEDHIKALVDCDHMVLLRARELAHASAKRAELRGVLEALSGKRDMIVEKGATRRKEWQGDPSIRETPRNYP